MACRIRNLSRYPLRIDLLGGETLHLPPGAVTAPLREERLTDNCYLREWEQRRLIRIEPARMSEVLEAERRAAAPPPAAGPEGEARAGPADKGQGGGQKKPGAPRGR